jgi:hypothetical protein
MKTKLIAVMALLAGSTLFAAPRVVVGIGVGPAYPAYGYGYVAPPPPPPPVYVAPVPAGRVWVDGYWGFVGARRVWRPGYWSARPAYREGFRDRGWRR